MLECLSEKDLGILALALVFEPRKGVLSPALDKRTRGLENATNEILSRIHKREKKWDIVPPSKRYNFHLSQALLKWMEGESFEKILRYSDADEGGIIRYFRMAIQILREILETPVSHEVKTRIRKALDLINHGIIDAEKQLRAS